MSEEKVFELMTKMYDEMREGFKGVNKRLFNLESDVATLKGDVATLKGDVVTLKGDVATLKGDVTILKGTVAKIEVEHGQKLSALFDGYTQNSQKLDRIEAEVAKHEELILKRIK